MKVFPGNTLVDALLVISWKSPLVFWFSFQMSICRLRKLGAATYGRFGGKLSVTRLH